MIKNIATLLLVAVIAAVIAFYFGWAYERDFVNHRLVVTAYNAGYHTGSTTTACQMIAVIFDDQIRGELYSVELPPGNEEEE